MCGWNDVFFLLKWYDFNLYTSSPPDQQKCIYIFLHKDLYISLYDLRTLQLRDCISLICVYQTKVNINLKEISSSSASSYPLRLLSTQISYPWGETLTRTLAIWMEIKWHGMESEWKGLEWNGENSRERKRREERIN